MSSPPHVLPSELVYEIAEALLCTKMAKDCCNKVDLRCVNGYTNFMLSNQIAAKMFIAQFGKMKEIIFNGSNLNEDPPISLYRNTEKSWKSEGNEFYGPYIVPKEFVGTLIDHGKLRLQSVTTSDYLRKTHSAAKDSVEEEASVDGNKSTLSIQSFFKLFLDKELSDEEASNICFDLDKLQILKESNAMLVSHFDELLNLNAKEILLRLREPKLFDCSLLDRTVKADRVEKLSLELSPWWRSASETMDALKAHWECFFDFLLVASPKMQQITIELRYVIRDATKPEQVLLHLREMVIKFTEKLFPSLSMGSADLRILANLALYCRPDYYEELLLTDDNLFKMGKEAEVKRIGIVHETHVLACTTSRECEIADQLGRQHKCRFQVLALDQCAFFFMRIFASAVV